MFFGKLKNDDELKNDDTGKGEKRKEGVSSLYKAEKVYTRGSGKQKEGSLRKGILMIYFAEEVL